MIEEEKKLIRKINEGQLDAFRQIIEKYQRLVSAIVYKMIHQSADHEDLCQDIFLKVYRNLSNFRGDSKLSVWISRIAYTSCLNQIKRNARFKSGSLDNTFLNTNGQEKINELPALISNPEQQLEKKELKLFLREQVSQLSLEYRTALTLYHWQGMDYQEISQIMGVPVNTLKSYIYRARKELKDRLINQYPGAYDYEIFE